METSQPSINCIHVTQLKPKKGNFKERFKNRGVSFLDFNYLREALEEDLTSGSDCFEWAVQFYVDEDTTPIQNAIAEWDTPFYPIAQIKIPQQSS